MRRQGLTNVWFWAMVTSYHFMLPMSETAPCEDWIDHSRIMAYQLDDDSRVQAVTQSGSVYEFRRVRPADFDNPDVSGEQSARAEATEDGGLIVNHLDTNGEISSSQVYRVDDPNRQQVIVTDRKPSPGEFVGQIGFPIGSFFPGGVIYLRNGLMTSLIKTVRGIDIRPDQLFPKVIDFVSTYYREGDLDKWAEVLKQNKDRLAEIILGTDFSPELIDPASIMAKINALVVSRIVAPLQGGPRGGGSIDFDPEEFEAFCSSAGEYLNYAGRYFGGQTISINEQVRLRDSAEICEINVQVSVATGEVFSFGGKKVEQT